MDTIKTAIYAIPLVIVFSVASFLVGTIMTFFGPIMLGMALIWGIYKTIKST